MTKTVNLEHLVWSFLGLINVWTSGSRRGLIFDRRADLWSVLVIHLNRERNNMDSGQIDSSDAHSGHGPQRPDCFVFVKTFFAFKHKILPPPPKFAH